MCGIAGFVTHDAYKKEEQLNSMLKSIAHRGPDAEGKYIKDNVALGHRRLIVVDPEGGKQPMIYTINGKNIVLIYNGELYNTEKIRIELKRNGHVFKSHSDTEVLLHAYIEWGVNCLSRLNGIFAFAVLDERDNSIFIARDRFGVKPLFYHFSPNNLFAFASEIKALLKCEGISSKVDREGFLELMSIGPARTPGCGIFKDIKELPPAHFMIYSDGNITIKKYFELKYEEHRENVTDTAYHLKTLLIQAIDRQLVSDVPLGTFLSGGLDSSIITALTADSYRKQHSILDTFSLDFEENEKYFKSSLFQPDSDRLWVEKMVQREGTHHHNIIISNRDTAKTLKIAMQMRDLPGMADIDSSLYLLCKEVKKTVTVGISGECADEVFGGYPWFYRHELYTDGLFPWSGDMRLRQSMLNPKYREKLNLEEFARYRYKETLKSCPDFEGKDFAEKKSREMFHLNIIYFMGNLLERKDRMSMANGLEVRVPYCDHELVQYVWNIPWDIKFYNQREKGILRLAMKDFLPDDILWRKKSPYPKTYHPDYTKIVSGLLLKETEDSLSPIWEILDKEEVLKLVNNQSSTPWYGQLMSGPQLCAYLLQMAMWLREYRINIEI